MSTFAAHAAGEITGSVSGYYGSLPGLGGRGRDHAFEQFVHEDDRMALADALDSGQPPILMVRVRNAGGEWRYLEAHLTDLRADRHLRGVLVNARDVTERRLLDLALEEAAVRRATKVEPTQPPELGGPTGPEPTRYGDWERKGIAVDF